MTVFKCRFVYDATDCYIFNTVLSCKTHAKQIDGKMRLTKNEGLCTAWLIRKFIFCVDPFFYQYVTTHIRWKITISSILGGHGGRICMVVRLQLPVQSPLMLWVWTSFMAMFTRYNIMLKSVSVTCFRLMIFYRVLRFPPPIKQTNIAEILFSVSLNTINQTKPSSILFLPKINNPFPLLFDDYY